MKLASHIFLGIALVMLWLAFLSYAPTEVSRIVVAGIAGWQVGSWGGKFSRWILDRE